MFSVRTVGSLQRFLERVVVFALFLLVFALCLTKIRNWDIWWHLKTGEWIVRHGMIPKSDFLTYTSSGAPWIDLHWGFQVLAWAIYHTLGGDGLILCKALLCLVTFFVLFRTYVPKRTMVFGLSLFFVTVLTVSQRLLVRPEALSMLFLAFTLKTLWDYCRGREKKLT